MTPLPGAVQSTGLILATVLAAAGLNLGVMSLGQPDGDGTDVETAATPTSAALTSDDGGLQALSDTAPAVDPGAATTVLVTDPAAITGSTLPAGTGVTPGPPVAAGTRSTGAAPSTAAPATAAASTAGATTATTRPPSTQAPVTLPPATVTTARPASTAAPSTATTARPTTTATTARPTTTTTRAPQTSYHSHDVAGAGSLTVSLTDGRLAFASATDASGWTHTVDTNRADLVRVVFKGRGNEIAVSVTLRNGTPNFSEERSNDD